MAEEDREDKEGATKISPGSTSSGVALVLVEDATTATLADKDDEELVSKAAAWLATWKNSHLLYLVEYDSRSIAGSSVDGKSLMLDRARMSSTASVAKSLRPTEWSNPSEGSWSTHGSPRRTTRRGTPPPCGGWRAVRPSWSWA